MHTLEVQCFIIFQTVSPLLILMQAFWTRYIRYTKRYIFGHNTKCAIKT